MKIRNQRRRVVEYLVDLRLHHRQGPHRHLQLLSCTAFLALISSHAAAQPLGTSAVRNTYGEIGLLDMPSARMAPDGTLALTAAGLGKTHRFSLDFQALPWLETSFRYSHYAPGSQLYDRSFSFKMRLLNQETDPFDLAVGIRDVLGTGIYSSEYVVASRSLGNVDVTLGMGWGRLADTGELRNPVAAVFPSAEIRGRQSSTATGGNLNFGQFFTGPRVGLFGGIAWRTPVEGLTLLAEYSSDEYSIEKVQSPKTFAVRAPVNVGFSYALGSALTVGAGWYYGSIYGVTLTLGGDMSEAPPMRIGTPPPPPHVRTVEEQRLALEVRRESRDGNTSASLAARLQVANLEQALLQGGGGVRDVERQGDTLLVNAKAQSALDQQCQAYANAISPVGSPIRTIALTDLEGGGAVTFCPVSSTGGQAQPSQQALQRRMVEAFRVQSLRLVHFHATASTAYAYYENTLYDKEGDAIGRALRVLQQVTDPTVEVFHLYPLVAGRPTQEVTVSRTALERQDPLINNPDDLRPAVTIESAPMRDPFLASSDRRVYPQFEWNAAPRLTQQLFDPNKPLGLEVLGDIGASLIVLPGLSFNLGLTTTIWSDLDYSRQSNSVLPHVRTDLLKYREQGRHGVSSMTVDYITRLSPEVHVQATAGYLEDMFMGVGGQIIWRPHNSRFTLGGSLYQVWQRDFNRLFGLQSYNVITGHASVYYESPWYGMNLAVHAGRYLAGDYGATFEITRRFSTGVEIGAYATLTNVPFSKFGEGSFDKGLIIHIPLEALLPTFTQTFYSLRLNSLTRDGGARLYNANSLYRATQRSSYGAIVGQFNRIAQP